MSAEEKREFVFVWKLRHFHRVHSPDFISIRSPFFEVEFLKGIGWHLYLFKESQKLCCRITRRSCLELCIPIDYQYELTTSAGDVLKTSDTLSHIFGKNGSSKPYELMELVDIHKNVCLRCRMVIPCMTPSMKPSPYSVVGLDAETDVKCFRYCIELSLKFSDTNEWTAVERVTVENIPIDIAFKYVDNELEIELFPKIEENTFPALWCEIILKDGKSKTVECISSEFRETRRKWKFPSFFCKQELEKANCFILKKLNMRVEFDYLCNSLISEIKILNGDSTTAENTASTLNKDDADNLLHLQQHLRHMFNEKICADVKVHADDEVFFAHKCLLGARSPVFRAMFDRDMLESKTNIIDIHDVEAKVLKCFLEYLYTGSVDDMDEEMALSLLVVADKYQVSPLSETCSIFLKSVLSFDNVLDVLLVADRVNQEQLKVSAVEYIVENSTQVLSSPIWPQWVKMNSTIASEVFLKLSNKFDSNSKINTV